MPGYNPHTIDPQVLSGNQCALIIGDQLVGFGQSLDPQLAFGTESLYGIGSAKPQEIQQFKLAPTISLSSFMLTNHGLNVVGIDTLWITLLCNNDLDIHIMDPTGTPLMTYVGCVADNFSASIPANQPVTQNTSFQAMDILDKYGNTVLRSNDAAVFNALATTATASVLNTVQ